MQTKLENIDSDLIRIYKNLPMDFWDFKDINVRAHVHGLHNYPATMIYPITQNIINFHKKFHDLDAFMDPYSGSGTGLVEAYLADFKTVIGNDLNPLARLMSRVKCCPISPKILGLEITNLIDIIEYNFNELRHIRDGLEKYVLEELELDITERNGEWALNAQEIVKKYLQSNLIDMSFPDVNNLGYWFKPIPLLELQIIKNCISNMTIEKEIDIAIRDFFWITFSETVRLCSNTRNGEFKSYRIEAKKIPDFNPNTLEIFLNKLHINEEKMGELWRLAQEKDYSETEVLILNNDARYLNDVPDNSVDLVVTSPPYGDSTTTVAYGQYSRPALEWIDLELTSENEKINNKHIRGIDKQLLGGTYNRKGDLNLILESPTLNQLILEIAKVDKQRALEVYQFYIDLNESLKSITRKTKSNSYQYWVVGNRTVKKVKLLTHQILIELGKNINLKHVITLNRSIPNKVMPHKNSPTNIAGKLVDTMTNEHIVVFRNEN